ncbi:MAG: T9SS type A sorting domain-containing protein [Bacteroidales bacterium]|nr:T9SS type A sorting domain-containing protein [Bacteroidales bacterium]
MKKATVVFTLLLSFAFGLTAQTFDILDQEDNVITGQNIIVPVTVNGDAEYYLKIRNNSNSEVTARISKLYLDGPVDGSVNTMCSPITILTPSGACSTGTQTPTFVLSPYEISGEAHMEFEQGPNAGVTKIQYKVFEEGNASNYRVVNVTFSTLTGISDGLDTEFSVLPNPAVSTFNIQHNYGSKAVVEIFNVLGKSVAKINSGAENTFSIDCSKWENGYYFCRLYTDGKIEKTIKLIVTH